MSGDPKTLEYSRMPAAVYPLLDTGRASMTIYSIKEFFSTK
jgi:hypothetical protein